MKRKRKGLIALAIVAAIAILGVGYAAITAVGFNIKGNASAEGDASAFKVYFSDVSTQFPGFAEDAQPTNVTGFTAEQLNQVTGPRYTAKIDAANNKNATFSIDGMSSANQSAIFTFTIQNDSTDLIATINKDSIKLDTPANNADYFDISAKVVGNIDLVLQPGKSGQVMVGITLKKTPLEKVSTGDINITFNAEPSVVATTQN